MAVKEIKLNSDGIRLKALNEEENLIVFSFNLADHFIFNKEGDLIAIANQNLCKAFYSVHILAEDHKSLRDKYPDYEIDWQHNFIWDWK